MKKIIFSLLCLVMVPLSGFADDTNTQSNTSGSNTNITGGYTTTNNNTYSGSAAGQSTSTTTNTTTNTTTGTDTRVAGMASAPSMSAYSQDLCLVGISGGVSTIGLSLSGGSYMIDENCERIKLSKTLSDLGMKVAAVSILCQDERVFFAMEQSGTPCPFEGKIGKAAADQWKKYDKLRPDYDMYTSRLWTIEQQKKEAKKKQELKEWKDKLEVKKEVEGDSTETDELAKEIKKLQETIKEDKKKVKNQ
tara:strand:+ start:907 stop:1653 length:747 start_codon:yes stop_codon:yes gene_type:complete